MVNSFVIPEIPRLLLDERDWRRNQVHMYFESLATIPHELKLTLVGVFESLIEVTLTPRMGAGEHGCSHRPALIAAWQDPWTQLTSHWLSSVQRRITPQERYHPLHSLCLVLMV